MRNQPEVILEVQNLKTYFLTKQGVGKAVDGVSFQLRRGETLGLVGESGCGKSMTALSILRLVPRPAARIVEGRVLFCGEDLLQMDEGEMRGYRGRHIAMVLQDPMAALNPVFDIGNQVGEALRIHYGLRGRTVVQRAIEMLKLLRIPEAELRLGDFPHQFSGGMRQRVVGAIALSCGPEVLIADEPTTSLDVTIQAQYLKLLKDIQKKEGMAIIFITHDFGIVSRMCDQMAVMYAGKIVETADLASLFSSPAHPYTAALLNSVPNLAERVEWMYSIDGEPPSIYDLPKGCHFAPRCPYVEQRCWEEHPPEVQVAPGHAASCWRLT